MQGSARARGEPEPPWKRPGWRPWPKRSTAFLVWLVYFHGGDGSAPPAASLPLINAILNCTSGVPISVGLWAIMQRKRTLHMRLMFAAFASLALFPVARSGLNRVRQHS